jgi:tetratricopeptide (TPR) repeat protein
VNRIFYLIVAITLQVAVSEKVFCQTDSAQRQTSIITADSIAIDPLKIEESGYVSSNKKILSVRASRKMLLHAQERQDSNLIALAYLSLSDAYIAHGNNKKAIENLEFALRLKDGIREDRDISHLYYDLAVVYAHVKQYTLALECFYKTGYVYQQTSFKKKRRRIFAVDTVSGNRITDKNIFTIIQDSLVSTVLSDDRIDSTILLIDTAKLSNNPLLDESPYTDYEEILNAFDNDKPAIACAVMIHIKQPVTGHESIFTNNGKVGHTFITLTKFNADSTVVSKTFGFYPEKDNILSATPLMPSTNSVFKDDSLHDWDELIGKFISPERFEKILDFLEETGSKRYNLNTNNCTDFGLHIAALSNIEIKDTKGFWPLGRGNNPGSSGQSILKGKFRNVDTNSQRGLFACSNNIFIKRAVQ